MASLTEREQEILVHAWQCGYEYAMERVAEAADDIGRVLDPPARSYEDRVAERMTLFEACAGRIHDDLARHRQRELTHHAAVLARAGVTA